MDHFAKTNRERWNALAQSNVEYSRPWLDLTPEQAAQHVYRFNILQDVAGKQVLCLASGGGQSTAAFGMLGAQVTSLDLSDVQLERDRQAAAHHGLSMQTIQGDMRDLSMFSESSFDVVWQIYSLNFIPSVKPLFEGVRRVLKPQGIYFVQSANPFIQSVDDAGWDGKAYPLKGRYQDGEDLTMQFPHWDVTQPDGSTVKIDSPHEFRHTLSTLLNTLVSNGFVLLGLWEWIEQEENPQPGSWAHFTQVAPPYISTFWRLTK